MNRRTTITRLAALLVGLAVTFGVLAPASATSVKGTADLRHKQTLAADPTPKMKPSCQSRSLRLGAGYYQWSQYVWYDSRNPGNKKQYVVLAFGASRQNLELGAGTYHWSTCLYPKNNTYYQISSLILDGRKDGVTIHHSYGTPDDFWRTGKHIWGDELLYFGGHKE